jgi:iron only hydrogenase large subunit-like protein
MSFSSILRVTGLNDFIGPELECTKPTKVQSNNTAITIEVGESGLFNDVFKDGSKSSLKEAKISLTDCLACSGCITTAEAVLVESQGVNEFLRNVGVGKNVIVSISPQARTSLAMYYNVSEVMMLSKLTTIFKTRLGVDFLFDVGFARDISLYETALEFMSRKASGENLPLLTGSCPGWVCYAEKKHGDLLNYISKVKSPQQIMGTLVKNILPGSLNVPPSNIYHVTIMTCYDKKLEASRKDFFDENNNAKEVDCVLVAKEIVELINDVLQIDMDTVPQSPIDNGFTNIDSDGNLFGMHGPSDGFAEFVFRYAAKQLYGLEMDKVEFKTKRNKDYKFTELVYQDQVVLSFATAYGFRNIQNVVRQIKSNTCNFDFVEIMACPGGCTNGAGQLQSQDPEALKQLDVLYSQNLSKLPEQNLPVTSFYNSFIGPDRDKAKFYFYTSHHEIREETQSSLRIEW